MSDLDSETLELLLDPATRFVDRLRAFDEAMKWAGGQGWDVCAAAFRELHGPIEAPVKPADMIVAERPVEEVAPPPTWSIEEVPVIAGHAIRHSTMPDEADRPVIRVPVRRPRRTE